MRVTLVKVETFILVWLPTTINFHRLLPTLNMFRFYEFPEVCLLSVSRNFRDKTIIQFLCLLTLALYEEMGWELTRYGMKINQIPKNSFLQHLTRFESSKLYQRIRSITSPLNRFDSCCWEWSPHSLSLLEYGVQQYNIQTAKVSAIKKSSVKQHLLF